MHAERLHPGLLGDEIDEVVQRHELIAADDVRAADRRWRLAREAHAVDQIVDVHHAEECFAVSENREASMGDAAEHLEESAIARTIHGSGPHDRERHA